MAPIVTDSMREWADAYVFACRDHAAREDRPFDAAAAERAIREALTEGARYNPRAEAEAEVDGWQPDDACAHHGRICDCDWHDRRQERAAQEAVDQAAAEARFRRDVERALKRLDDGMVHDYQTQTKVVRMEDGTEYETPFDELGGES